MSLLNLCKPIDICTQGFYSTCNDGEKTLVLLVRLSVLSSHVQNVTDANLNNNSG